MKYYEMRKNLKWDRIKKKTGDKMENHVCSIEKCDVLNDFSIFKFRLTIESSTK